MNRRFEDGATAAYIVRPVFFVVTVLLVIGALAQAGGRLLFANLHQLEPRINALLAQRNIQVSGLEGDWRFFNPVLRLSAVSAPGVTLGESWAEIDTIESLARNRIVLRNAQLSDAQVVLVETADGWRLEGAGAEPIEFDWRSLIWHSDQLQADLRVEARGLDVAPSRLWLLGSATNFGGRHRGQLEARVAGSCEQCGVSVRYGVNESALWFRERHGGMRLTATSLAAEDSLARLLGVEALQLGQLDARLRLRDEQYSGPVSLLDSTVQLRGGAPVAVSLLAEGVALDDLTSADFRLAAFSLSGGGSTLALQDTALNWRAESGLAIAVDAFLADDLMPMLGALLPAGEPAALWVERLAMKGRFEAFTASWVPGEGVYFDGDFSAVGLRNFRGVPAIQGLSGRMVSGPRFLELRLADTPATVGFPELYREPTTYSSISGKVLMYFGDEYFGLEGSELRFVDPNMTSTGSFSLVSRQPVTDNHITLAIYADGDDFADLEPYVPYKLPQNVLDFLAISDIRAAVAQPSFVMHGPLREEESAMGRSYLLDTRIADAGFRFNPEWPRVTQARGHVQVSHAGVRGDISAARLQQLRLSALDVELPSGATRLLARGTADFDAAAGLQFVRTTPLKESVDFLADDWWAEGGMRLQATLDIPLDDRATDEPDPRLRAELRGTLRGTTFGMPEAGLTFTDLRGPLRYRYPYALEASGVSGKLFGKPVQLDIANTATAPAPSGLDDRFAPRQLDFAVAGEMASADLWPLINMTPSTVLEGDFPFSAVYATDTRDNEAPQLNVRTTLTGAEIRLPAPLGKRREDAVETRVQVSLGEQQRAQLFYGSLLHADFGTGDDGITGGHLRLRTGGSDIARWDGQPGPVRIDGVLASADAAQWSAGESEAELPDYRFDDLRVQQATVGSLTIENVRVGGGYDNGLLRLEFAAAEVEGVLAVPDEGISALTLARYEYATPADEVDDGSDPITPAMMNALTDMDVTIEALAVDGEDYGRWQFGIRADDEAVAFADLAAELRGLRINSAPGVRWLRSENRSYFDGTIGADDMADVLTAWGYAPSLESQSMLTEAKLSWPGSPLNFELDTLQGNAGIAVNTGRFLDVTNGQNAMRIFSLLNFTAIAKRMTLNFKDVFGRGISFEEVRSQIALDEGVITFLEPMRVDGTGGDFKINGSIDLLEGELDNEMVVTLPVNKSLPWLGAYLALANPAVGIGVLVGERILRKPIKGLSSAKYKLSGSVEDPQLELVSVFDRSMEDAPLPESQQATAETGETAEAVPTENAPAAEDAAAGSASALQDDSGNAAAGDGEELTAAPRGPAGTEGDGLASAPQAESSRTVRPPEPVSTAQSSPPPESEESPADDSDAPDTRP